MDDPTYSEATRNRTDLRDHREPQGSNIFEKSALKPLLAQPKTARKVLDLCQFDRSSTTNTELPLRRPLTTVTLGFSFSTPPKRCVGPTKCDRHGDLHTDLANDHYVYPWFLVSYLVVEFQTLLQLPKHTSFLEYWTCPRCKHGPSAGTPHTRKHGCRYAPGSKKLTSKIPPGGVPGIPPPVPKPKAKAKPSPTITTTPTPPPPEPHPERRRVTGKKPPRVEEPDPTIIGYPTYIEPSFDIKRLRKILEDPEVSEREKLAGLLGLHIKFWHASAADMHRMMQKTRHGKVVLDLIPEVIKLCEECVDRKRT